MLKFGRHVEQTDEFKSIMDGGLEAKPPVAGQFWQFLEKNDHFNVT